MEDAWGTPKELAQRMTEVKRSASTDLWGTPLEIAQKMAEARKQSSSIPTEISTSDSESVQVLVDGKFWSQVTKRLPPTVAKWVLENKGSSEKKFILPNSILNIELEDVKFGFFALQMTRASSHGYVASWGGLDSKSACSSIEKSILLVAIERGLVPGSIRYCGVRLVAEEPAEELASSQQAQGFVYFVRNGDIHKIGITENLLRRLSELKPDEVLNVIKCSNYRELEKRLHSNFREDRIPQTEYFRLDEQKVLQANLLFSEWAEF